MHHAKLPRRSWRGQLQCGVRRNDAQGLCNSARYRFLRSTRSGDERHVKRRRWSRPVRAPRCFEYNERVPEISRFFGIVITMYYDEHPPPHFHARYEKKGV